MILVVKKNGVRYLDQSKTPTSLDKCIDELIEHALGYFADLDVELKNGRITETHYADYFVCMFDCRERGQHAINKLARSLASFSTHFTN